jgi:small subunit ribosomal protein S24e
VLIAPLVFQKSQRHKVADNNCIVLRGFKTAFGGGKSVGFVCVYDTVEGFKKYEPKHMQIRAGLKEKVEKSRKQIKELKNRGKKTRGTGVRQAKHKAKRTQDS